MTLPQILAFSIVGSAMVLFVWGRLRYDLVAVLALLASVAVGIVPADRAFAGFSDDIVIIVASALLISAAVGRSGAIEVVMRWIAPRAHSLQLQVILLVSMVTVLSAFVKNVGALAIAIPVAFQLARRWNTPPSSLLMPMAFGSLLGGIITLVGTSPNIIVSRVRAELVGTPFGMFDFTPVGLGIALVGVLFLTFAYRLLPTRKGTSALNAAIDVKDYTTEAVVVADSPAAGLTIAELHTLAGQEVAVVTVIREGERSAQPLPDVRLRPKDTLILQGDPSALERLVAQAGLVLTREDRPILPEESSGEVAVIEAIVSPDSLLVGRTAEGVQLYHRYGVNLLAVSRRGEKVSERLRSYRLRAGDLVVLQGVLSVLPDKLKELGCLPLAERRIALGSVRRGAVAIAIFATAVFLVAFSVVPIAIAFFAAAALLMLFKVMPLREAYSSLDWPILIMLGALIPVSDAIRTTGGTDLIAGWLSGLSGALPAAGSLALIMVVAMAVTPFLNNAATVLVMAPIAAEFAKQLGYSPDAFLMAVAIGAACDFLTPIGHQCNTLVLGPGGYRFGDYARLGAPLSVLVVVIGVPLILLVWPLR